MVILNGLFSLLTGAGVPLKLARPLAYLIAAVALVGLLWGAWALWLADHDADVIERDRLEGNLEAERRQGDAKEKAATERLADEREVRDNLEDLKDAIREAPETVPDPARVLLNCERLRRAGADTTAIPECRRSGG